MTKVRDKSSVLSDNLLSYLEYCFERNIQNVERINSLKLYLIINNSWLWELGLSQQKFNDY